MKLVTYNLRNGGGKKYNLWRELVDGFSPDIVFAQETRHPKTYFQPDEFSEFKSCIHADVETHKQWGSAILSKQHDLVPISLSQTEYKGWVVGAMIHDIAIGEKKQPLLLFSLHAPTLPGTYEGHVQKILEEIASTWPDIPLILGGDFNLTTAISRPQSVLGKNTDGELRLLNMLNTKLGLVNAWQHLHPDEDLPQTLRWSSNKTMPFHCDAIFLHHTHLPQLSHASVKSDDDWGNMSDHNPIFVILK